MAIMDDQRKKKEKLAYYGYFQNMNLMSKKNHNEFLLLKIRIIMIILSV